MATKWGILSAGKISHDFVTAVKSFPEGDQHQFVAIAARKLEDATAFAQLHNIPRAYGSYEELAKDAEVEVVYIGAINPYHYPLAKLMLENGKPVLLEKPFTLNLKQTKELLALAKEKKLFIMEALWSRFLPAYEHLMSAIKSGKIGEVRVANVSFGLPIANVDRISRKDHGGGGILDLGVYTLNALTMIFGGEKPVKVAAVGSLNDNGVDNNVSASFLYSGGRVANMMTSAEVQLPCEAEIFGTKGKLKLNFPMWCPNQVVEDDKTIDFPMPTTILPCNFINSAGLYYEAAEVRRCLKEGLLECPRMTHADTELLASLMDELRKQVGVVFPEDD